MAAISGKSRKYLVVLTTECTRRFGNTQDALQQRGP